ncbi:MAG TPA: hypothetical protein VNB90_06565 [Cytophagaceae bacterium]|jgi:hypothetical protein|nr:hypothetical protein [Cytophagaceae bacterium]
MKKVKFLSAMFFSLLIAANVSHAQKKAIEKNGIKLTPVTDSPKFPDAGLKMISPVAGSTVDTGKVHFQYELTNYKLTDQTMDAQDKHCSNSAQGQHIHLILNNAPYLAKYETDFYEKLKEGNYVALSFLSRSYHESLKHKSAYVLTQFTVGKPTGENKPVDLTKPLMFYSRPKGEYVGADAKKVLLDFYLVNCTLSEKSYKVRATINSTEFTLTRWEAFAMEGLPMGENTIKLELLDKDNKLVENPYNPVVRKITLKP